MFGNSKPQKASNQAIEETKGQVIYYQGEIATTYYYSTSCGRTTDIEAWGTKKTKKNAYLKAAFERDHPEFIEHLKECGLDEEEIRYCCMEALGVKE